MRLTDAEVVSIRADLKRSTVETVANSWGLDLGLVRRIWRGKAYRFVLGNV